MLWRRLSIVHGSKFGRSSAHCIREQHSLPRPTPIPIVDITRKYNKRHMILSIQTAFQQSPRAGPYIGSSKSRTPSRLEPFLTDSRFSQELHASHPASVNVLRIPLSYLYFPGLDSLCPSHHQHPRRFLFERLLSEHCLSEHCP